MTTKRRREKEEREGGEGWKKGVNKEEKDG